MDATRDPAQQCIHTAPAPPNLRFPPPRRPRLPMPLPTSRANPSLYSPLRLYRSPPTDPRKMVVRCRNFSNRKAILVCVALTAKVSPWRIRLAAYVTRLERVRGSRPSWVQIPHPPPREIPRLCSGRVGEFSFSAHRCRPLLPPTGPRRRNLKPLACKFGADWAKLWAPNPALVCTEFAQETGSTPPRPGTRPRVSPYMQLDDPLKRISGDKPALSGSSSCTPR